MTSTISVFVVGSFLFFECFYWTVNKLIKQVVIYNYNFVYLKV